MIILNVKFQEDIQKFIKKYYLLQKLQVKNWIFQIAYAKKQPKTGIQNFWGLKIDTKTQSFLVYVCIKFNLTLVNRFE